MDYGAKKVTVQVLYKQVVVGRQYSPHTFARLRITERQFSGVIILLSLQIYTRLLLMLAGMDSLASLQNINSLPALPGWVGGCGGWVGLTVILRLI